MEENITFATPNDVLEFIAYKNEAGEIKDGAIPRVNGTEMPVVTKAWASKPGRFVAIDVPKTGYYVAGTNELMVSYDLLAEALGVDVSAFERRSFNINIEGMGFNRYCYVEHNGVEYTSGSFEANVGDTIKLYANFGPKNHIILNGQTVATGGPCSFDIIVDNDYVIDLKYSPASHAYITATEA